MTVGPQSQCSTCVRFRSPFDFPIGQRPAGPTCAAFPDGIPKTVLRNGVDHRQAVDSDHGVRWESNGEPFPAWALASAR